MSIKKQEKVLTDHGISVGGIHYDIRNTKDDNERRCAYFKQLSPNKSLFEDCIAASKGELTESEIQLLTDLGIDEDFQMSHSYDLYLFFKELPNCQTTAALTLNHGCSNAHYVLFSVLMQAQQSAEKEFKKHKFESPSTDKLSIFSKMLSSIGKYVPTTPQVPESKMQAVANLAQSKEDTKEQDVFDIFTLQI